MVAAIKAAATDKSRQLEDEAVQLKRQQGEMARRLDTFQQQVAEAQAALRGREERVADMEARLAAHSTREAALQVRRQLQRAGGWRCLQGLWAVLPSGANGACACAQEQHSSTCWPPNPQL